MSNGVLGFRDLGKKQPLMEDTICQLASVSKVFTSTAVMLAVLQGLFGNGCLINNDHN
ncbi:MAG: serine hydrolase [Oscillospiraceae bacterium]|nr:serine hydrolase [Oscillospiraceae bacterium]